MSKIYSKDCVEELFGQPTAISGKRQEMDSGLDCPTPQNCSPFPYSIYAFRSTDHGSNPSRSACSLLFPSPPVALLLSDHYWTLILCA
jgi:hypothetical protein